MKKILNKNAFTLLETILSIAIITAVALPLLTIFLQSVKTDQTARNVLNANYISQDYIERLDGVTYAEALSAKPTRSATGDYYLSANINPSGISNAEFNSYSDYVHVIYNDDGSILTVMPDGQWNIYQSANSISLNLSGNKYTFSLDGDTINGNIEHSNCIMQINAMKKPSENNISLSLGSNSKIMIYCKPNHKSEFTANGNIEIFEGVIKGETSLVKVNTYVYDSPTSTKAVSVMESSINIRNW